MKIQYLRLCKFLPYKFIKEIDYKCLIENNIICIIGQNGTGKSNLINSLSPYMVNRSLFEDKEGYKQLNIENQNNIYTLITDFSKQSNPHSFTHNNIELNIGGSQQIQFSLIEKYLNYSSILDDCLHLRYRFSLMNKSERKDTFFKINPINLEYILQLHKECQSQIKYFKNNLKSLHLRKGELETKILDQKILDEYQLDQDKLNKDIQVLNRSIILIDQDLNLLQSKIQESDIVNQLNELTQQIKDFSFQNIVIFNNTTIQQSLQQLTTYYHSKLSIQEEKERQQANIYQELQKYQQIYNTFKNNKSIFDIDQEIEDLRQQIKTLEIYLRPILNNVFFNNYNSSHTSIEIVYNSIEYKDLCECLKSAVGIHTKIWTPTIFEKVKIYIHHKIKNQGQYKQNIQEYQNTIQSINDNLSQYEIPKNCNINDCLLKIKIDQFIKNNLKKLNKAQKDLEFTEQQYKHIQFNLDHLQQTYDINQKIYQPIFQILNKLYDKYQFNVKLILEHVFQEDILNLIRINPLKIISILNEFKAYTETFYKLNRIKQTLNKALMDKDKLTNIEHPSIDFVIELIQDKTNVLLYLDKDLKDLNNNITYLKQTIDQQKKYIDHYQQYQLLIQKFEYIFTQYFFFKQYEYLNSLKKIIHTILIEYEEKLQRILIIKNEQIILSSRYQEEVMKYIDNYNIDQINFSMIEQALSPLSGIPCKLIQNFLNQIINNVNFFLSKVWVYPFQLLPLDQSTLDFQFPYLVGDEIVSDISKGSEAQKIMIDFAFILSILVLKRWINYPLFLDEIDKSFDETHKSNILELLEYLLNEKIISQLFIVGHHSAFYSGFQNKKIIDLSNLE